MALERAFLEGPGLRRFFGNHDLDWEDDDLVERELGKRLPGITVREALRLRVLDGDEPLGLLFFAHGHQGTDASDRFAWFSRWVLRHVWRRVQAKKGWLTTTPATSYLLRAKHDTAMFHWARASVTSGPPEGRPVLSPATPTTRSFRASRRRATTRPRPGSWRPTSNALARRRIARSLAALHAELERVRAGLRGDHYDPPDIDPPCYFNTAVAAFPTAT